MPDEPTGEPTLEQLLEFIRLSMGDVWYWVAAANDARLGGDWSLAIYSLMSALYCVTYALEYVRGALRTLYRRPIDPRYIWDSWYSETLRRW